MATLTHTSEVMSTLELEDLRESSLAQYPRLSQGYHYGASESNVTYPEGLLERINLKAGNGRYSGLGTVANALDETTLLNGKRLKAQTSIIGEMIESLAESGQGDFKIVKVITLFNPIKLFVLLSNGNVEQDIVYMSVNGRSNGSGQRKELNWPEGVSFTCKRSRRVYFEKQVKAAQKKVDDINKTIEKFESGKREEAYSGELNGLKTWQLKSATDDLTWAQEGLANNS